MTELLDDVETLGDKLDDMWERGIITIEGRGLWLRRPCILLARVGLPALARSIANRWVSADVYCAESGAYLFSIGME